jgi:hypothetical protein
MKYITSFDRHRPNMMHPHVGLNLLYQVWLTVVSSFVKTSFRVRLPGMRSYYSFLSCAPVVHSCYVFLLCGPVIHSCYVLLLCGPVIHSCYVFLLYTPVVFLFCGPVIHSCYVFLSCAPVIHSVYNPVIPFCHSLPLHIQLRKFCERCRINVRLFELLL